MKHWIPLLTVIAFVALGCAPAGNSHSHEDEHTTDAAADRQVIEAATGTWIDAFNAGDAAGIAALYPEDGRLYPPNAPPVQGRENIRGFWQGFIDAGLTGELSIDEIKVDGDLGYKIGGFKIMGPDGETVDEGHYLEIWERRDGEWVFARDIWNSDLPLTGESEGE